MRRVMMVAACAQAALFVVPARGESPAIVSSEFIFEKAPFPSCHASTIVETTDGQLVAAWFGGTAEKHKDVGIWVSRREGDRWTPPDEVANGVQYMTPKGEAHRHPCWNPVFFQPNDSSLLLFYKCGPSPDAWWGMLTRSSDDGKSWSFPRRLPEDILGPIKNKPVAIDGGRILCPSSSEHDGWRVHFEITPDHGRTWTRVGPINDGKEIGAIQPSILKHKDRKLQALGRSQQGKIWTAWSDDNGLNWEPMTLLDLPNPNSGTDAVTLADGRHLLVYNHTEKGRTPLNVAISSDGKAWEMVAVLEDEPGEYSYPAVIQTADRLVHITYTWKRERIRHVVLDPKKLEE
ncbi:MAG: sialidase family protein [Planctomycetaceae bacterium]